MQANTGQGPVALTRLEFLLLKELMEHADQPVPKDQLLASIWGYNFDPGSNVVDVCVRRLRSKLGYEQAQAAVRPGAAMSVATAAEYALLLAAGDPATPQAPPELSQLKAL